MSESIASSCRSGLAEGVHRLHGLRLNQLARSMTDATAIGIGAGLSKPRRGRDGPVLPFWVASGRCTSFTGNDYS